MSDIEITIGAVTCDSACLIETWIYLCGLAAFVAGAWILFDLWARLAQKDK